jgi:hypothetical protein
MGHKLKIKCVDSRVNVHNLSSTGVPLTLTTVQVLNLALTHKKRITVKAGHSSMKAHRIQVNCCAVTIVLTALLKFEAFHFPLQQQTSGTMVH